jgi:hypothetical protein
VSSNKVNLFVGVKDGRANNVGLLVEMRLGDFGFIVDPGTDNGSREGCILGRVNCLTIGFAEEFASACSDNGFADCFAKNNGDFVNGFSDCIPEDFVTGFCKAIGDNGVLDGLTKIVIDGFTNGFFGSFASGCFDDFTKADGTGFGDFNVGFTNAFTGEIANGTFELVATPFGPSFGDVIGVGSKNGVGFGIDSDDMFGFGCNVGIDIGCNKGFDVACE